MDVLSGKIKKALEELGYNDLTEIQRLSIPLITQGKNLIIGAPTGYGKTLAAFLPFLDKIERENGLQLLYITPLRSLNRDIFKNLINLANKLGIEIDIRHGDTTAYERANQVRLPPNCLITTPETLQSMFLSKKLMEKMKQLRYVIVDEVQSLMESKRGTQLSIGLERLRRVASFQTVGISATVADFEEAKRFLKCTDHIKFEGEKKYNIEVVYPKIQKEDEKFASVENMSEVVANSIRYIQGFIETSKATILFTNTRESAELLGSRVVKYLKDKKMEVHHSSLSKEVRTEIENRFKVGDVDLVVATSSLELGIDIGDVDLVIQYMSPRQVIKLIQRVGRSNHRQSGIAEGKIITINLDDYLESLAIEKCRKEGRLEVIPLPKDSLDILAHQIVGCVIDGMTRPQEIFDLIRSSYAYETLTKSKFDAVLDFLLKHYMIRFYGSDIIRTRRGLLFYIQSVSSIPNKKSYTVMDDQLNKKVGVLDEGFVAEHCKEGEYFIMKGETWKIVKVEDQKINVVRSKNSMGAVPGWEGELMPVYRFVAETAADMRKDYTEEFPALKEQKENFYLPDSKNVLIEKVEGYVIFHSPFGNKINEGIAKALSYQISSILGESVLSKVDPYRVMIKTSIPLENILKILVSIKDPVSAIKESISHTSLFEYRFLNVAKRLGVINKYADFTKIRLRSVIEIYKGSIIEEEAMNEIFNDKIDIAGVIDVIEKLKNGKIKININDGEPSPLAYEGVDSTYGGSLLKPADAKKMLRELVIERLENTRMFLQCMNCGNKVGEMNAGDSYGLRCRKCGARLIGFYKTKYAKEYLEIVKKGLKGKKLSKNEEKVFEGIKLNAGLYLAYDGKACLTAASYGVGPRTASRILMDYNSKGKEELIDKIIEAEKNYIETREYWD
ncbi:DEAD/DEAH box helicase [Candidatus Parvarchaeota archaeon]|nr:DEAD/DEAH box helicase [Candidatus Parvarchaeota archaeon]